MELPSAQKHSQAKQRAGKNLKVQFGSFLRGRYNYSSVLSMIDTHQRFSLFFLGSDL